MAQYHVGAVGLGASGRVLLGVNLELAGLPLSQAVHAEQFVIANAVRVGERRLTRLAVSAAPCGHCRQFMAELPGVEALEVMVAGTPPARLPELLPYRFGPEDLLHEGVGPRLLEPHNWGLKLDPHAVVRLHRPENPPSGEVKKRDLALTLGAFAAGKVAARGGRHRVSGAG